jgi:hypothetical protein
MKFNYQTTQCSRVKLKKILIKKIISTWINSLAPRSWAQDLDNPIEKN